MEALGVREDVAGALRGLSGWAPESQLDWEGMWGSFVLVERVADAWEGETAVFTGRSFGVSLRHVCVVWRDAFVFCICTLSL